MNLLELIILAESRRSAESEGPFTNSMTAYVGAKSRAFNATKEWMATHRPYFDVIHIQPTFVLGRDDTVTEIEKNHKGHESSHHGSAAWISNGPIPRRVGAS